MAAWQEYLAKLIGAGVAAGQFHATDCSIAAMRILALIDGMIVQAAIPQRMTYQAVREMVITTTERELGCPPPPAGYQARIAHDTPYNPTPSSRAQCDDPSFTLNADK